MSEKNTIEHVGVISEINDQLIRVIINVQSACASCHASAICNVDSHGRIIEVLKPPKNDYIIGDNVKIKIEESKGFKALFLGYLMPFIIILAVLLALISFGFSEGFSGLISVLSLLPYYFVLYFFRDKIKREFNFKIEKI